MENHLKLNIDKYIVIYIIYIFLNIAFPSTSFGQRTLDTIPPYRPYLIANGDTIFSGPDGINTNSSSDLKIIYHDYYELFKNSSLSSYENLLNAFKRLNAYLIYSYKVKIVDLCNYFNLRSSALDRSFYNEVLEFNLLSSYTTLDGGMGACLHSGIALLKKESYRKNPLINYIESVERVKGLPNLIVVDYNEYYLLIQPDGDTEKCTHIFEQLNKM